MSNDPNAIPNMIIGDTFIVHDEQDFISSSSSISSYLSSSSYSSMSSLSSSSSLKHSSSSISSSSSTSFYLGHNYHHLVPFQVELIAKNNNFNIVYYNEYAFVGTGPYGEIIRSWNRTHWGVYYKTTDLYVSALECVEQYLYCGTSPKGELYKINLNNNLVEKFLPLNDPIIKIINYFERVWAFTKGGQIYRYSPRINKWVFEYNCAFSINDVELFNDQLYIVTDNANIINYNGFIWRLIDRKNIYNEKHVGNFLFHNESFIDREQIIHEPNTETILEVYPKNRPIGFSCITQHLNTLLFGSKNQGKIYYLANNEFKLLLDTDAKTVHDIVSIDEKTIMASMDQKLYLIYLDNIIKDIAIEPSSEEIEEIIDEQETTEEVERNINVVFPNGGEFFKLGENIDIQWTSNKSSNDIVKISLYYDNDEILIIASRTLNTGEFRWTVPFTLPEVNGYRIKVEWISPGEKQKENYDMSDNYFSLSQENDIVEGVEDEIIIGDEIAEIEEESLNQICHAIPVLELQYNEYITKISKDEHYNVILFLTSTGRILSCDQIILNAYLTGERKIKGTICNGLGYRSQSETNITYALYKAIAKINKNKEIIKKSVSENYIPLMSNEIYATFISPIFKMDEDVILWDQLIWENNISIENNTTISVRTSNNLNDFTSNWNNALVFHNDSNEIINEINLKQEKLQGNYIQIKIDVFVKNHDFETIVSNLSISYLTSKAYYFFTNKISLQSPNIHNGIIKADFYEPVNTKIDFGITNSNSSNWKDYDIIPVNEMFTKKINNDVKIGVRLKSYNGISIPYVSNFSIFFGGENKQRFTL